MCTYVDALVVDLILYLVKVLGGNSRESQLQAGRRGPFVDINLINTIEKDGSNKKYISFINNQRVEPKCNSWRNRLGSTIL